jgi:hypothetical protein
VAFVPEGQAEASHLAKAPSVRREELFKFLGSLPPGQGAICKEGGTFQVPQKFAGARLPPSVTPELL